MQGIDNDKASIQRVHKAAMKEPLDKFSELVVDVAKELVGADNGRLRFVDYTEKRLVPGAIRGALAEKPEMAVREIGECIVGQAAAQKRTQFVLNVQDNEYFKLFKTKVSKMGEKDEDWKNYHDKTLENLGSEIAVPVMAGSTLLGVLSVNALKKNAFQKNDEKILSAFASEIAVAFLNRRAMILEELHRIEEEMISVFELKEVAQNIADGIQKMVKGSIPNIFLYDELFDENCKENENPFQFLASSGASEAEKELGSFTPRWSPNSHGEGRGMEAIQKYKAGEDSFIVVEDVQQDSLGSPTAREKKIMTTCCLPLVFRGFIVGVLYLHFKEMHFFTIEEKRILKMFAIPVAIAIKNATMLPTYVELIGNGLINQLNRYKPNVFIRNNKITLNGTIWNELNEISEKLNNSRGEDEISQCILDGVKKLCKVLDLPVHFSDIFSKFQIHENILYKLPYYRDHFIHMFHVFYLGYLILNGWWNRGVSFLDSKDEKIKSVILKKWFITSIQHDIAYPVEMAERWVPRFPKDALDLDVEILTNFDWSPILLAGENTLNVENMTERFLCPLKSTTDNDEIFRKEIAFKKWFIEKLLKKHDHGALGSLSLLSFGWSKDDLECALSAALNVLLHNYWKNPNNTIGQLAFGHYPLAFLLTYCDAVQEWGRPQVDPFNDLQKLVDPSTKFGILEVDLKHTAVVLSYNIEERCQKIVEDWSKLDETKKNTQRDQQKHDIRISIDKYIRPICLAWEFGGSSHKFEIKAQDENGETFCTISII
ncbi:MAG: GAF domain-containing protein [Bacteriovorax sp.]|nr:GAF domain-containing protein [Bacteriovorax sp.]